MGLQSKGFGDMDLFAIIYYLFVIYKRASSENRKRCSEFPPSISKLVPHFCLSDIWTELKVFLINS